MTLMTIDQLYAALSLCMVVVTLGFVVAVARVPSTRRKYYAPLVVLPAVTAVALWMVSRNVLVPLGPDGEPVPLPRMFAYGVFYPTLMAYIGLAGGVPRRGIATIIGLILLVVGGLTFSWLVPAPIGPLGLVVMLLSLVATAYLLLGPYARIAAEQTGERTLLYGKLRNLLLLLWAMLIAAGLSAPQSLGLLDRFLSAFMGNYIDLLAATGFGLIVLRSQGAMDQIFREEGVLGDHEDGTTTISDGASAAEGD